MCIYLARIEHTNDFFNIRPVMEFFEDGLVEVNDEKFGQYGTITISSIYGKYNESPLIQDQKYCIFQMSDKELSSLDSSYSGYKIKAADFVLRAKSVDSLGIMEVIGMPAGHLAQKYNTWGKEPVSDVMKPVTNLVYLQDDEKQIFGPFKWSEISNSIYRFIPNSLDDDPYYVKCFQEKDFEDPIYQFDAAKRISDIYYGRERKIVRCDTMPTKCSLLDCIDNAQLKEIVGKLLSQSAETKKAQREIREAVIELPIEKISEERKNRILELAKNGDLAEQAIGFIPKVLIEDEDTLKKIVQTILSNQNYSEKLYLLAKSQEGFSDILEKLEAEKNLKQLELNNILDKIQQVKNVSQIEKDNNFDELKQLKSENECLIEKLRDHNSVKNLEQSIGELEKEHKRIKEEYDLLSNMNKALLGEVEKKIKEAYSSFAFDGAVSNLMMKEALKFEKRQVNQDMEERITDLGNKLCKSKIDQPCDLVNFVYDELTHKAKRNLNKNDVANLLICIAQGFLTIFAGEPGTGKTSLANWIANILGLRHKINNRFTEIAVEKGWTSRRDLIGYYNPLTKSFDAASKGLVSALSLLKAEQEHQIKDLLYLVLLDEANLSQMEYYWADFMSLCDFDKKDRIISLGEDYEYPISDTLRFLATINLDHTTEILSPRLIDRAWIIMLQSSDIDIEDMEMEYSNFDEYPMISYDVFNALCLPQKWESQKLDSAIIDKFNKIRMCFQDVGISFSPRILGMIKKYCLASRGLFDVSENAYVALDYSIAQKVLPIINGYGDRYQLFLDKLLQECDQNTMPRCYEILQSILRRGNLNMQYYQFFSR